MDKYPIKLAGIDFDFVVDDSETKGSREKRKVLIKANNDEKERAVFKYELYNCTESCSKKIAFEIAKVLDYSCARIELARDENGVVGVLNYDFVDKGSGKEHTDFGNFFNIDSYNREREYTLQRIKELLDGLDVKLYNKFVRIMIFDALIGESDRHEENWGIMRTYNESGISIDLSPLYDNGCSLLREFKDRNFADKYYTGIKTLENYINRGKMIIYNSETGKHYKHFELMEYLKKENEDLFREEVGKLERLDNDVIETVVERIPDELMIREHKNAIKEYLKLRKEKLCELCG